MKIQGVVLAGGKSRRFGSDKALAKIDGMTLLERAVGLLRKLDLDPVIITSESRDYSSLNCRIEKDIIPGKGPLGGIYTGLSVFSDTSLLALTCDMPYLTESSLSYLIQCHKPSNLVTVYQLEGPKLQPFPGIYEPALSEQVLQRLNSNRLSMHGLLESVRQTRYLHSREPADSFRNINERTI